MDPSRHSAPALPLPGLPLPGVVPGVAAFGASVEGTTQGLSLPSLALHTRRWAGIRNGIATVASTAEATVTSGAERRESTRGGSCLRRAVTVTQSSRPVSSKASWKVRSG